MKKHYIFKATGIDMQQHGKKRTEYRHEVLQNRDEACLSIAFDPLGRLGGRSGSS